MQVFIPYRSPYMTASCLDKLRLNKQIIEAKQIISAINNEGKGWFNHPIVKMYKDNVEWLKLYTLTLESYFKKDFDKAFEYSYQAFKITPSFIFDELCDQHKRRLFTKNPIHYKQFENLGTTDENWYVVDGQILKYVNGKRIN